jgi:hypothetical protein
MATMEYIESVNLGRWKWRKDEREGEAGEGLNGVAKGSSEEALERSEVK